MLNNQEHISETTVFYLFPSGLWAYWHLGHTYLRTSSSYQHHLAKSHENTNKKLVDHSGRASLYLPPLVVLGVQLETL
jgi:hypothetical protein